GCGFPLRNAAGDKNSQRTLCLHHPLYHHLQSGRGKSCRVVQEPLRISAATGIEFALVTTPMDGEEAVGFRSGVAVSTAEPERPAHEEPVAAPPMGQLLFAAGLIGETDL